MEAVNTAVAVKLGVRLKGHYDPTDNVITPAAALSCSIAHSVLFRRREGWRVNIELLQSKCHCGHIGPPFRQDKRCFDCEIIKSQRQFWKRYQALVQDPAWSSLQELWNGSIQDPRKVMWRIFWHGYCLSKELDNLPGLFRLTQRPDSLAASADEPTDNLLDSFDESSSDHYDKSTLLEIVHSHLKFYTPYVRFWEATTPANLDGIPRPVAIAICDACRQLDRQIKKGALSSSNLIRRAARPLGEFQIAARRGDIRLKYRGRVYLLIRYTKDPPTRSVGGKTGRHCGCVCTLLSESDENLRREIEYFARTGKLVPSARRFTRPNPLAKSAPEDRLSVTECFVGRKRQRYKKPVRTENR